MGKARGFSIWPKTSGNKIVFGSVAASVRYMALHSFIAVAPLIWWVALYFVMRHLGVIKMVSSLPDMNLAQLKKVAGGLSLKHVIFIWLFFQLLWAGWLSTQDIKNFFKGAFSVSGLVCILAGAAVYLLLKTT